MIQQVTRGCYNSKLSGDFLLSFIQRIIDLVFINLCNVVMMQIKHVRLFYSIISTTEYHHYKINVRNDKKMDFSE